MLVEWAAFLVYSFAILTRHAHNNLYSVLVNDALPALDPTQPMTTHTLHHLLHLFTVNFLLWATLFGAVQFLFYCRASFQRYKLNPTYPPTKLLLREFLRSVRGVFICSLIEILVEHLYLSDLFPLFPSRFFNYLTDSIDPQLSTTDIFVALVAAGLVLSIVGETHF